ncbi:MAG: sigma-70 family RNA polymerase sigma factor [Candidatus Promineifilaceae bacterium]|nr:sigma-70 family RNA polymerase sigma factor [Candidatus Promineifilaceae bacterium]
MRDYDNLSDTDLIEACRDGDELAWDALVARYERLVYTVPARYGLSPGEVDDVFQSVWLALLKNLDRLRQPERVAAWLVTTARRECWERRRGADYDRRISLPVETMMANEPGKSDDPEETVSRYQRHELLHRAMRRLDPRCQELLALLYYEQSAPAYADIAELMDMPIGSIGPVRARCLKKLQRILQTLMDEE